MMVSDIDIAFMDRFCHHVAIALGKAGLDVDVSCTDRQLGGRPLPFRSIMQRMRNATFCLSMPGELFTLLIHSAGGFYESKIACNACRRNRLHIFMQRARLP